MVFGCLLLKLRLSKQHPPRNPSYPFIYEIYSTWHHWVNIFHRLCYNVEVLTSMQGYPDCMISQLTQLSSPLFQIKSKKT